MLEKYLANISEDIIKLTSCASVAAMNNNSSWDDEENVKLIYLKIWYWQGLMHNLLFFLGGDGSGITRKCDHDCDQALIKSSWGSV